MTCLLIRSDASILDTGVGALRIALEQDLRAVPRRVALQEADRIAGAPSPDRAALDRLYLTAAAGRTAELVLGGHASPLSALAGWVAEDPPAAAPWARRAYAGALALASCPIVGGDIVLPTAGGENALRLAMAVNARTKGLGEIPSLPAEFLQAIGQVGADLRALDAAQEALRRAPADEGLRAAREAAWVVVVADGVDLFGHASDLPPEEIGALRDLAVALARADTAAAVVPVATLVARLAGRDGDATSAALRRVASFIAALSGAGNSEEARAAIAAWAAPLGGFDRKHTGSGVYFDIQAYVGITGGVSGALGAEVKPRATFAPFVPVGFEFGRRGSPSLGVMVSVIDVGRLAAWRIDTAGEDVAEPKVSVEEAFAPGLWGVVGPWRAPFALGVGGGLSPRALEVDEVVDGWHIGAFLAVDLPLFP